MKKNILLDPGIIPFLPLKDSINHFLVNNKLTVINVNPYKNGWDKLESKCELISYSQLKINKSNEIDSEFNVNYTSLLKSIINDHRTLLIFERVKSHFDWTSLFNGIQTLEIITFNSVKLLLRLKPDTLLFQATPHNLPSWILAKTAEFMGIKVNMIQTSPLPWRFWLVEGLDYQYPVFPYINVEICEKDKEIFETFWQLNTSDYQTALPGYERKRIQSRGGNYWSWKKEISDGLKKPKLFLKLIHKRFLYNRYNSLIIEPDLTKKYIVLFLHYQPERTSLPESELYAQQWLIIKNISLILPQGYILYVKEHPSIFTGRYDYRYRSLSFYENITSLQNVKLISIEYDTFKLIDNSLCIATITGTVGVQALMRGKPVMVFGVASYRNIFGVYFISNMSDLQRSFKLIIENFGIDVRGKISNCLSDILNVTISGIDFSCYTAISEIYSSDVRIKGHVNLLSNLLENYP